MKVISLRSSFSFFFVGVFALGWFLTGCEVEKNKDQSESAIQQLPIENEDLLQEKSSTLPSVKDTISEASQKKDEETENKLEEKKTPLKEKPLIQKKKEDKKAKVAKPLKTAEAEKTGKKTIKKEESPKAKIKKTETTPKKTKEVDVSKKVLSKAEKDEAARLEAEKKKIAELLAKSKSEEEKSKPAEKSQGEEQVAMISKKEPKDVLSSNKTFLPEDMPAPAQIKMSDDSKKALSTEDKTSLSLEIGPNASSVFKEGMDAYAAGNYSASVTALAKIPKPASKKAGTPERDEYVRGNYFRGLALQKLGRLSEAVEAYQNVLTYERYFPICQMNQGICYLELNKFAKADGAFRKVIRDQNRIPPEQYDDIMQRTRYFWALSWTRLYKYAKEADKKDYFMKQANQKWNDYKAWYGTVQKYAKSNSQADNYIKSLQNQ